MEHLLFAGYLIVFAWLVTKVPFFKHSGLTASQLVILFLVKIMVGIFYGWIGVYYGAMAQMLDTWAYHYVSLKEYHLLLNEPYVFFADLFRGRYENGFENFFSSNNSWWNDLHNNIIIKLLALFDILSLGNYYINVIFYTFITLFGVVAIYRVMADVFPKKKLIVLLATFFIPSFLYWTSGIHKDGLVFTAIALIVYHIYFGLKGRFTIARIAVILLACIILLIIRNYLIVIVAPAVLAWIVAEKIRWKPVFTFGALYLLYILLFFTARYVYPKLDFPQAVVNKQYDFMQLEGASEVSATHLKPTFKSFALAAPQALSLALFRPYPGDVKHLLSLAASVEIMLLLLLCIMFLLWRTNRVSLTPFMLFCIFFSFSVLLTIGYTVNFLGAVVRYRSIIWPFLIVPVVAQINWNKLSDFKRYIEIK